MKKLLVSIMSKGDKQLEHLNTITNEYLSYKNYDVTVSIQSDIDVSRNDIVLNKHDSNIDKMPYAHRQEFLDKINDYDLFLCTENDMLVKEEAINVYMKYDSSLPINYCIGFIRYEKRVIDDPNDENLYCLDIWPQIEHISNEKITIENNDYFILRNPFQSCFLFNREKLNYVINNFDFFRTYQSGVEVATAGMFVNWDATKGVINRVCTRNLEDLKKCLIHHLPNKHCNYPHPFGADFCSKTVTFDTLIKKLNII